MQKINESKFSEKAINDFIKAYNTAYKKDIDANIALKEASSLMHLIYLVYGGTKLLKK